MLNFLFLVIDPKVNLKNLKRIDWLSFLIILTISLIGLIFIFSTTYQPEAAFSSFLKKQCFGLVVGCGIYLFFSLIDYRILMAESFYGYAFLIALLIFTIIKGHVGMGARRWINLYFIKFQPSELVKILLPGFLTYYYSNETNIKNYKQMPLFLKLCSVIGITFLLILKQPDLGTAIIVLLTGVIMLWISGVAKKFFIISISFVLITSPIAWKFLKPYQKKRIEVFLGAGSSQKERYQIEQSKIAIGSGGLLGKGILKGSQNQLRFLPESRTDFIFAALCEEIGLLGALTVLLLYLLLFLRILLKILTLESFASKLLAIGLLTPIVLCTIININMVAGLLPIVGIPLPLMSYGLTSLWVTMASLGWINGIFVKEL